MYYPPLSIYLNKFAVIAPLLRPFALIARRRPRVAGRGGTSGVIKEHIFPSLSDFDLIFIALRRRRARRRVRRPFGRNLTQFLRLIRTFKAVNEDWPHIPSARSLPPPPLVLPPSVVRASVFRLCFARARACARAYVPVQAAGVTCSRSTYGACTPNVFCSITTIRSGGREGIGVKEAEEEGPGL